MRWCLNPTGIWCQGGPGTASAAVHPSLLRHCRPMAGHARLFSVPTARQVLSSASTCTYFADPGCPLFSVPLALFILIMLLFLHILKIVEVVYVQYYVSSLGEM